MIYGEFMNPENRKLRYLRRIIGILFLQSAFTFSLLILYSRNDYIKGISTSTLTLIASIVSTSVILFILIKSQHYRSKLPEAHFLVAGFILGSAFFTVAILGEFPYTFNLLFIYCILISVSSLLISSIFSSTYEDALSSMKIGGCVALVISALLIPFGLKTWYGEDYKFVWVFAALVFQTVLTIYIYHDICEFQS